MPASAVRLRLILACWLRQTSTRSGLLFVTLSAAGYTLTEEQITLIMAIAGAASAAMAMVWPDRKD